MSQTLSDIKREFLETNEHGFVVAVPSDAICAEVIWLRRVLAAAKNVDSMNFNNGRQYRHDLHAVLQERAV